MPSPQPLSDDGARGWQARWFELMLAGRLLRSRRSVHLSLVTGMSVAGIALGVAALIVVLAVNTGFQTAFQDRILATYPHLVILQRGVDLRDYRSVIGKLAVLPGVRSALPATYDDMMLSSAGGRAGAVVRGVPPKSLAGLPEGAVVQGALDPRGELPQWRREGGNLRIERGVAAARHVLVVSGAFVGAVPVLAQQQGLGGLVIFDAQGCDRKPETPDREQVYLVDPLMAEPLRRVARTTCEVVASWEVVPGDYKLRWAEAGQQRELAVTLTEGRTTTVVLAPQARVVPPPSDEVPATAAALAVVALEPAQLAVTLPDGTRFQVDKNADWHGFSGELPSIAIGEGLAKRLQVGPGDEVRAVSPMRGLDRASDAAADSASGRFRVSAVLRTGFHDHDQRLAIVDFVAAQRFLGRGDIARWVEVRVDDPILASARVDAFRAALEPTELADLLGGAQALRARLRDLSERPTPGLEVRAPTDAVAAVDNWVSGLRVARQQRVPTSGAWRVIDWEEMNRNIFDAARMQKVAMSLFPFIIVLVAALNVVGTQAVVVHERAREIAILRAMGSRRRSVAAVFLVTGLVVGVAGTIIGLLLGGLTCLLLDAVGYPLDPQVYLISQLPVQVEAATFVLAGGSATVLAFAAAWFSAQRAAARAPVEALRRLD